MQKERKYKLSFGDRVQTWEEYKTSFSKKYDSPKEERERFAVFRNNLLEIEQHNDKYHKGLESFWLDINHYSDITTEEFNGFREGCRKLKSNVESQTVNIQGIDQPEMLQYKPSKTGVAESKDWRKEGYVTKARNQHDCGSCWAFSAVGALEGQWFKTTGQLVPLSVQQLVDCDVGNGDDQCDGGYSGYANTYIKKAGGLETEEKYPYEAASGECRFNKTAAVATLENSAIVAESGNEEVLKNALFHIGPLAITIDGSESKLKHYGGGVYRSKGCKSRDDEMTHQLLLVGYGSTDGEDYWIVKNSWGEKWGENGFGLIARNAGNMCGVATDATFPIVNFSLLGGREEFMQVL